MLDLHCHSTASDGAFSPAEVVRRAARLGIRVLALTDHDTVDGIEEARTAGATCGVDIVTGVELSATWDGDGDGAIHVLGYLFDERHARLRSCLSRQNGARDRRNVRILERLAGHGLPVSIEDVTARARGSVGRPHIARARVARGHVPTVAEAFDRWIGDGRPCFVDKEIITPKEAIDVIHQAGGAAVLAHPLALGAAAEQAEALIRGLVGCGLDGVEVDYGAYSPGQRAMLRCFADRHGLVPTGGSDFHDEPAPPQPDVPMACLTALEDRAGRPKG